MERTWEMVLEVVRVPSNETFANADWDLVLIVAAIGAAALPIVQPLIRENSTGGAEKRPK